MITFPLAKINLGLNVVNKREDGYHDLKTVCYPIPIYDALEIHPMDDAFPSDVDCDLKTSNIKIEGDEQNNLVVKAYKLISSVYKVPRIHAHLFKGIPTQAGMGGGSSDCAFMIRLLNDTFNLNMDEQEMIGYAAHLGADCPFFIISKPAYAEGIGELLEPISLDLKGWHIAIVKPDIPVSTKEAFSLVNPQRPGMSCKDIVKMPVENWRKYLTNDFERSVFSLYPEIASIKDKLYSLGAVYAAMSGSGSSVFGLFKNEIDLNTHFKGMFNYTTLL